MEKQKLKSAIEGLDPKDASNWTTTGLPDVDVLSASAGEPVTREEVTAAKPGWDRASATTFRAGQTTAVGKQGKPAEAPRRRSSLEGAPSPAMMASSCDNDALLLIEAFCVAVGTERYRRNQPLQQILRAWQNEGQSSRERQTMLDAGDARRTTRNSEAKIGRDDKGQKIEA